MFKKTVAALVLAAAAGMSAWAQAPASPWSWDLQAGYNNSSKWLDSGWNYSTALGYTFNDHFKFNFDLGYLEGKVKDTDFKDHIWTFQLEPEYVYSFDDTNQFYAKVGVGVAKRDSYDYLTWVGNSAMTSGSWVNSHSPSESKFAASAALGYRHFFNKNVGLSLQATYTHMSFQEKVDPVDGRVGLVVRF